MKNKFNEAVDLKTYTHDSPEARNYKLKSATAVFVNNEFVPPDTAFQAREMEAFLKNLLKGM